MPRTLAAAALAATLALGGPATAAPTAISTRPLVATPQPASQDGLRAQGPDFNHGKPVPFDTSRPPTALRRQIAPRAQAERNPYSDPQVGDTMTWLALDDTEGTYLKDYTLRGLGNKVQVWVAEDRAFPDGDCRNDLGLTEVTDAQVRSFVREFDTRIHPLESRAFSTPPARDGSGGADLAAELDLPADYWKVGRDQADDIVTLVDNVRDTNFYAPATPDGQTYIGGFFYSVFNDYVDRNIMTIDAFDWLHRTGATPPDDRQTSAYRDCAAELGQPAGDATNIGNPRPRGYEGTFAHEYQHLLEHYQDPDEETWVNEGLSDWAQSLVGYVDPSTAPDEPQADGHISCFQGFRDPSLGGPENSLTAWGDQGGPEILCDYGAAYTFMEYLHSHYGDSFMRRLHREDRNGLDGITHLLERYSAGVGAQETVHRWAAAAALDQVIDRRRGRLEGGDAALFTARSLSSKINWANSQAYDSPGAPPNGSDYVRLRNRNGTFPSPSRIGTIRFRGARTLEPTPVEWTEDTTPPAEVAETTTCGEVTPGVGPAALHSGCGDDLDRSLVRRIDVPAAGGDLHFEALWDIEEGWDLGAVQVSADEGRTWQSLATDDTTTEHDEGADPRIVVNLPGFTGESGTWRRQSASLDAWKGKQVLVGFRYLTDASATEAGFWVRNITAAGTVLPSTLDGWQTITQARPVPVSGWTVQLVSYGRGGTPHIHRLRLDDRFRGGLTGSRVRSALGTGESVVAAIVTHDDPTGTSTQSARYSLRVNGTTQPGG